MTTLLVLRGYLNDELGITTDAETTPFSLTLRNRAISQGYAALWRAGVWKPTRQDIATVSDSTSYATTLRRLRVIDLLDSSSNVVDRPAGRIEDSSGSTLLLLKAPIATGYTMRVSGWTAYVSTFADDNANDDLAAEFNRIPLLKAKAIVYRKVLSDFARYGSRQTVPSSMNLSLDQVLGLIAAAEREFEDETRALRAQRDRAMVALDSRPLV